jgi:hypothetical protein
LALPGETKTRQSGDWRIQGKTAKAQGVVGGGGVGDPVF